MFEEHPCIKTPPDSATVWRYMTIDKFLYLLTESKLYFCRVDRLSDSWEGVWPVKFIEVLRSDQVREEYRTLWQDITRWQKWLRGATYVNCWHLGEHESAAMWTLYAGYGASIAIRSRVSRLKEGICRGSPFYVGSVEYLDYTRELIAGGDLNMILPFFAKRKSFEHEHELRVLVQDLPPADKEGRMEWEKAPDHVTAQVNLSALIEQIFISPAAPAWLKDVLAKVINQFGLQDKDLHQSSLQEAYMY